MNLLTAERYLHHIKSKAATEHMLNFSPEEIHRVFSDCVAAQKLIEATGILLENGRLSAADLPTVSTLDNLTMARYVSKFQQGPDVFILWYRQERQTRELPYPHEVCPELCDDAFYEHPAWKVNLQ